MERTLQDFRFALRTLRQRPLFALIATLSIAIGIGATTTIFSVVHALLVETPPGVAQPERVVEVGRSQGGRGFDTFSYPELLDMRSQVRSLDAIAGWRFTQLSFSTGVESERINGMAASAEYFEVFGLTPSLGRFYSPAEDQVPGAHAVAVLSHSFWQERLGGDPAIIGQTIDIDRHKVTVLGVAPADFQSHLPMLAPDVYFPLTMWGMVRPGGGSWDTRWASWLPVVARLAPRGTEELANAELATLFKRFEQPNEDARNARSAQVMAFSMTPAAGRAPVTAFLAMLLAFVGLVLLITCANVAGMLIARAAAREREIAIRLAIGSSRAAIVRQLIAETLVLFAIGGSAGALIAMWGTSALSNIQLPTPIPVQLEFSADPRVLLAGLGLALVTGLLFGLAPAVQASKFSVVGSLKAESNRRGTRGSRMRRGFVMAQIALSLILLACSGLFLRSLQHAARIDGGFNPEGVKMVLFDLNMEGYDEERGLAFQQRLLETLKAEPGVISVSLAQDLPLDLSINEQPASPEDWQNRPKDEQDLSSAFNTVSAEYFQTLRTPILRGRAFDARDVPGAPRAVIVSQGFAERVWPKQDPLGKRIRFGTDLGDWPTVVGVAANVKNKTLMETTEPIYYTAAAQDYNATMYLLVHAAPSFTDAALRQAILSVDPRLSTGLITNLEAYTAIGTMPQRIAALLTTALGMLALLLSAMGVYGVIAFTVAQRTREIGTRMALGADRGNVVSLILRDGLKLAGPGVLIGLLAALALAQLLRGFILGVAPFDPVTFGLVPLTMVGIVGLACWAPARRAAGIQPIQALKSE